MIRNYLIKRGDRYTWITCEDIAKELRKLRQSDPEVEGFDLLKRTDEVVLMRNVESSEERTVPVHLVEQ